MATFHKYKVRENGSTSYRQPNSIVSVVFPATAFEGDPPDTVEIGADGLTARTRAQVDAVAEDPAVTEAKRILAEARAARTAALAARVAAMTPAQLAKRDQRLAKLKAKNAAKRAASELVSV